MKSHRKPLSDEDFAQLLIHSEANTSGESPAADGDLQEVRVALCAYRHGLLHWAERRSAAEPSLATAARQTEHWAALPRWSLALVVVITIAGAFTHFSENRTTPGEPQAVRAVEESPGRSDIEADNRLLLSIEAELDYHPALSVDSLRLREEQSSRQTATPGDLD